MFDEQNGLSMLKYRHLVGTSRMLRGIEHFEEQEFELSRFYCIAHNYSWTDHFYFQCTFITYRGGIASVLTTQSSSWTFLPTRSLDCHLSLIALCSSGLNIHQMQITDSTSVQQSSPQWSKQPSNTLHPRSSTPGWRLCMYKSLNSSN